MSIKKWIDNAFNSVAYAGYYQANASINRKGILFINRMSIINTFLMLAFSLTVPFLNLSEVLVYTIPFTFLFALPPLLNKQKLFSFCRYYFALLPLSFLTFVCIHNGNLMGDKYLILTTSAIPLILFKRKRTIYLMFAVNILVFLFIVWFQNNYEPLVVLEDSYKQAYYVLSQLTVFLVIFYIIMYFRDNNEKFEAELEEKNRIISIKNHEIIDSIVYAKRIQEAIMPPIEEIYETVPESFVLYKPKDIVAGDFYFAEQKGDYFIIAAADCTGHGVPGAMVSVVCSNALNKAVGELGLVKPGEILDKVTELVVETFKKSLHDVKDGMDISLCVIDLKSREIAWAGANNPLWYIEGESEMQEIKATKQPIGKSEVYKPFNTHSLKLSKGSLLYLFTDGFADQFGGPKGKKFK
ncbi:MAG: PP2C family protein-serine/threonine phosphatase [Bacteroidia bacterium]